MIRTDKMRDGEKEQPNQKKCSKFFRSSMVNFAFIVITLIYFLISLSPALLLLSQTFSSSQLNVWNQQQFSIPQMIHNVHCFCIAWLRILWRLSFSSLFIKFLRDIFKSYHRLANTTALQNDMNGFTFIAMTDQKNCTVERYSRILFAQTYL